MRTRNFRRLRVALGVYGILLSWFSHLPEMWESEVLIYAPHSIIPVLPLAFLLQVNLLVHTIYKSGEFVILIILLYEFRR